MSRVPVRWRASSFPVMGVVLVVALPAIARPGPALFLLTALLMAALAWALFARRQAGHESTRAVRYHTLFEDDVTGKYISQANGRILDVNPALARMFGFDTVEQMLACPAHTLYADPTERERLLDEVRELGRVDRQAAEFRRRDGSPLVARHTVVGDFGPGGTLVETHGYLQDVTAMRQAQEALAKSETMLRAVVANAPLVIWALDSRGVFTLSEGKGLERLGRAPGEIVGHGIEEVYGDAPAIIENNRRALGGETFSTVVETGAVTFEAWYSPLRDSAQSVIGAIGVAVDVTERQRLEAQLRHSQKMEAIGQLAGGVAHDFNNLLTAILGYSDVLATRFAPSDPMREAVDTIRRAGESAATLTRQLLAFSRRQVIQPRATCLNDVVGEVATLLRRVIGENVTLHTVLAGHLSHVWADPEQFQQVLLNLAVNARDAMPDGGSLTIETANATIDDDYALRHRITPVPGAYVRIAVTDSGHGMDAETRARVFEPFFTTKAPGKGTGLGLATVYGIVKQSGGYVWVYSEPGRGTTFKIYLPVHYATAPATDASEQERVRPRAGTETILLVEDEDAVRLLGERGLGAYGYSVISAASGEAALDAARRHEGALDLVITDVVLPGMSGNEMARRLARDRPDVPVLFVSGYAEHHLTREGVLGPEVRFLEKPFTPRQLAERVREVLDGPPRGTRGVVRAREG